MNPTHGLDDTETMLKINYRVYKKGSKKIVGHHAGEFAYNAHYTEAYGLFLATPTNPNSRLGKRKCLIDLKKLSDDVEFDANPHEHCHTNLYFTINKLLSSDVCYSTWHFFDPPIEEGEESQFTLTKREKDQYFPANKWYALIDRGWKVLEAKRQKKSSWKLQEIGAPLRFSLPMGGNESDPIFTPPEEVKIVHNSKPQLRSDGPAIETELFEGDIVGSENEYEWSPSPTPSRASSKPSRSPEVLDIDGYLPVPTKSDDDDFFDSEEEDEDEAGPYRAKENDAIDVYFENYDINDFDKQAEANGWGDDFARLRLRDGWTAEDMITRRNLAREHDLNRAFEFLPKRLLQNWTPATKKLYCPSDGSLCDFVEDDSKENGHLMKSKWYDDGGCDALESYLSDELADERERAWRAKTGEQRRAEEKERRRKEQERRKREEKETEKLFEPMTIPQLRLVKIPPKLTLGNYIFDDDGYGADYDSEDSQMGSVDDGEEKGDEHMREASGMKRKVKRGKDEVSDDDEESHGENDGAARKRNWNSMNCEKMDAGSDDENEEDDIQPPPRKVRKTTRASSTKFSQLENVMF